MRLVRSIGARLAVRQTWVLLFAGESSSGKTQTTLTVTLGGRCVEAVGETLEELDEAQATCVAGFESPRPFASCASPRVPRSVLSRTLMRVITDDLLVLCTTVACSDIEFCGRKEFNAEFDAEKVSLNDLKQLLATTLRAMATVGPRCVMWTAGVPPTVRATHCSSLDESVLRGGPEKGAFVP